MTDWKQRTARYIAEYEAMVEKLPITNDPFPDLEVVDPIRTHYTRRDTRGNVYGYFAGCRSEGMLGIVIDKT